MPNTSRTRCMVVRTLLCCPLAGAFQSCSCIVVAVSSDCLDGDGSAGSLLGVLVQLLVVYGRVAAVVATDWYGHVLVRLCSCERTWSAGGRSPRQRGRCTIPALVPGTDGARSTSHTVTLSECQEAATTCIARVVSEDVMLKVRAGMRHGWLHGRLGGESHPAGGLCRPLQIRGKSPSP